MVPLAEGPAYDQNKGRGRKVTTMKGISRSRARLLSAAVCLFTAACAFGDSVQVLVPPVSNPGDGKWLLAWNFQAKTVAQAFPSPADGTVLYMWDPQNQGYIVNTYYTLFGWDDPNYVLKPGEGFFYQNPTDDFVLVTLTGDSVGGTSYTVSLVTNGWNLVGNAYPVQYDDVIECVLGPPYPPGYYRTNSSFGYQSAIGDVVYIWTTYPGWEEHTAGCTGGPQTRIDDDINWWTSSTLASPSLRKGEGIWLYPTQATSWVFKPGGYSCP